MGTMITKEDIKYFDKLNINTPEEQKDANAIKFVFRVVMIFLILASLLLVIPGFCILQDGIKLACI